MPYDPIKGFTVVSKLADSAYVLRVDIVLWLNSEIAKLMAAPDTQKTLSDAGVEVAPSTPEAMADYMVSEIDRRGKVVNEAGIKME